MPTPLVARIPLGRIPHHPTRRTSPDRPSASVGDNPIEERAACIPREIGDNLAEASSSETPFAVEIAAGTEAETVVTAAALVAEAVLSLAAVVEFGG